VSWQKKARNGNMYVPQAAMPIIENKDLDHTEDTTDTKEILDASCGSIVSHFMSEKSKIISLF